MQRKLKKKFLYLKHQTSLQKVLLKSKTKGFKKSSGRNNSGKITVAHKGGGHKRSYRFINFFRSKQSKGIVCSIEYDPNRTSFIASVYDTLNREFYYILAPQNLSVGDIVESGPNAPLKLGNAVPLKRVPLGSYMYNLATNTKECSKMTRSAGTFAIVKEKKAAGVVLKLSSGLYKLIKPNCYGSLGIVSNETAKMYPKYKAGQSRWLNKRPTVRGVAMNPIDHPHGGGEGKKSGLNKSPWGKHNQRGSTSRSATNCYTKRLKNE
jgi:large subunit ribosomal protein L2